MQVDQNFFCKLGLLLNCIISLLLPKNVSDSRDTEQCLNDKPTQLFSNEFVEEPGASTSRYAIDIQDAPYTAFIYPVVCNGAIISEWFILTAGQCLLDTTLVKYVGVGDAYWRYSDWYEVADAFYHQDYGNSSLYGVAPTIVPIYDIGLVELRDPLTFSLKVASIPLVERLIQEHEGFVSGWDSGNLDDVPDDLQALEVITYSTETCVDLSTNVYQVKILPLIICAEPADLHHHADWYMSPGGPLVSEDGLVGLLSWGDQSKKKNLEFFTSVYHFRDWIYDYTGIGDVN